MNLEPLIALAKRQGNVVSVRQGITLGFPYSVLHHLLVRHILDRPCRGVRCLPGADLEAPLTRMWLGLCAVGSPAWISGLSSLHLRGQVRAPSMIDIAVPRGRKPAALDGTRIRRLTLDDRDTARVGNVPALTVERSLSEAAVHEPYDVVLGATAAALQDERTTLPALNEHLGRVRTGARVLRQAVDDLSGSGAQSSLAHRVTDLLRADGFTVESEVQVRRADGRAAYLDLVIVGTKVAIEVDGHATHSGRVRLADDRRRQNQLTLTGWTVLRVDWHRLVTDPAGFLAEVRAAVAATR